MLSDRMLMWSHYGDQHRSVCVGIDVDLLLELAPKNDRGNALYSAIKAVDYTDIRPTDEDPNAIFKKSSEWRSEEEYRVMSTLSLGTPCWGPGVWNIPPEAIKEIVIGARVQPEQQEKIAAAVARWRPDVSIRKAVLDMKRYRIQIEALSAQPDVMPLTGSVSNPNGGWLGF